MHLARRLLHTLHQNILWCLLTTYLIAALFPGPGLALRRLHLVSTAIGSVPVILSMPALLLGLMLFNASLGIDIQRVKALVRHPYQVFGGLAANLVGPLSFTLACSVLLSWWHDVNELQSLLVGLAIVSCMPIAGSSTAWAQKAGGDMALSLGLVLGSTLLSPLTTPFGFWFISLVTEGSHASDLRALAGAGTQAFLIVAVIVPSVLGMGVRALVGETRVAPAMASVKASSLLALLLLNYANASVALPKVVAVPDWDFLALVMICVSARSALGFLCGFGVGRLLKASPTESRSLVFGLGMNNNGSGLVLASLSLSHHPNVLLSIVAYNLVQQLAAGLADRALQPREAAREPRFRALRLPRRRAVHSHVTHGTRPSTPPPRLAP